MRCILLINKQLVELLFIKRSLVINHQILQTITQYINYKLSIDYESELLLYNLISYWLLLPMRLDPIRRLDPLLPLDPPL